MVELPLPIETSRLRLRSFVPGDLAALHAIRSREEVHRWRYSQPCSEDEVREMIERRIARVEDAPETGVALAVELRESGELVGDVSLTLGSPEHRQAEIGFIFHPDHHGQGYATEAAEAVVALAFGTYDLHRVYGRLEARTRRPRACSRSSACAARPTWSRTSGSRASGRASSSTRCSRASAAPRPALRSSLPTRRPTIGAVT